MEEKNPGQGDRSLDQMGTHGGPGKTATDQPDMHVASIERGLLEKKPEEAPRGPVSEEQVNQERAEIAQAQASAEAMPAAPVKRRVATGKSVRGGKNKADKAGKVGKRGKAGRLAAARGAKKGTRGAGGKSKKQGKKPL